MAFTSLNDANIYLQAVKSPQLELELISRQSINKYLDRLEQSGFLGVSFDATPDGAANITLSLAELRQVLGT